MLATGEPGSGCAGQRGCVAAAAIALGGCGTEATARGPGEGP